MLLQVSQNKVKLQVRAGVVRTVCELGHQLRQHTTRPSMVHSVLGAHCTLLHTGIACLTRWRA
jgi:hypothetical protein